MRVSDLVHRLPAGALVAALLVAFSLTACNPTKSGPGGIGKGPPKIQIVGGDSVNWGRVSPGMLKRDIKIVNVGGDTLKISGVHPSCGCTTAPIDKNSLLPGDTATVKVSVDVTNRSGEQHKTLTVASNDSTRSSMAIALLANVVREIVVTPEFFPIIDSASTGVEDTSSVEIKNTGDQPVTIDPPTFAIAPEMAVRFDMAAPRTLQPGEAMRVMAHVNPLKQQTSTAQVVFHTSDKNMPEVKVSLTCTVRDGVSKAKPGVKPAAKPDAAKPGASPAKPAAK